MADAARPSSDKSDREACMLAFGTLIKCLDELSTELRSPLDSASTVERQVLVAHVDRLEHNVTKFALFIAKEPTKQTILPMTQDLLNEVTAVGCLLRVMMKTAGPSLQKCVSAAGSELVLGVKGLVVETQQWFDKQEYPSTNISEKKSTPPTEEELGQYQKAGVAFAYCKAIKMLPLTNTEAVAKEILRCISLLKDAKNEVDELKQETGGDDDNNDDIYDEDDFGEDLLTQHEFANVEPCKRLASMALTLMKKSYSFVIKLKDPDTDKAHVDWVEAHLSTCRNLTKHLDVLACSLLPPQDDNTVRRAFAQLSEAVCALVSQYTTHSSFEEIFPQTFPAPMNGKATAPPSRESSMKWVEKVVEKTKSFKLPVE